MVAVVNISDRIDCECSTSNVVWVDIDDGLTDCKNSIWMITVEYIHDLNYCKCSIVGILYGQVCLNSAILNLDLLEK